jgi:hypothetical protein
MFKEGDKVRFINEEFEYIPYGAIGEVIEVYGKTMSVNFPGYENERSESWVVIDEEISHLRNFGIVDWCHELSESLEKPSDNPTLTIPLVNGIESFTGQFSDSEGNVYSVSVEKLPLMRQK